MDRAELLSYFYGPVSDQDLQKKRGELSDAELAVVRLTLKGYSDTAIGEKLGLGQVDQNDIKNDILDKLKLNSMADIFSHFHGGIKLPLVDFYVAKDATKVERKIAGSMVARARQTTSSGHALDHS